MGTTSIWTSVCVSVRPENCAFLRPPPSLCVSQSPPCVFLCPPQVTGTLVHWETGTPGHWDIGTPGPGWDKIFHFVGANTFSQKFRPKQRESDATKDSKTAIIWVFLPVTRNVFLWQDISASDKKFHTVTRNFFLWQEISNYGMKFLPVAKSFFLW